MRTGKKENQNYYEVSRIPESEKDDYTGLDMISIETAFDWQHPSEKMYVAATGTLSQDEGLSNLGTSCFLRTSETGELRGTCYTFYFHARQNQLGIGIQNGNGKAMGGNVRCVRDL